MAFDLSTAQPVEGGFDLSTARPVGAEAPGDRIRPIGQMEGVASLMSGMVAAPVSGMAGLAASVLPGQPGAGAEMVRKVGNAMTYQPRSQEGQKLAGLVAAPFEWLAGKADQAGGAVAEATGSPLQGAAVNTAIQALPLLAGRGARALGLGEAESAASIGERAKLKSLNSVKDETLAAAHAEGYVVPPSAINGSYLGNRMEGIAGKAALRQDAQLQNQPITNKIARREAGLAENSRIDEETLKAARDVIAEPYREVADLPGLPAPRVTTQLNPMRPAYSMFGKTPDTPAELVRDWKSTNSKATELWRDYQRNAKVETLEAYKAKLKEKETIEANIEKAAVAAGRPDLVPALREARVKLAKNYTVERALNLGSGDVDAATLGRMLDKGLPLTDGLETIGKFENAFSPYLRDAGKVPTPGVSKVEGSLGVLFGLGGHAALGLPGVLAATLPFVAPHAARALMLSKAMQKPRGYGQGALSRLLSSPATANALETAPFAGTTAELEQRRGILSRQ